MIIVDDFTPCQSSAENCIEIPSLDCTPRLTTKGNLSSRVRRPPTADISPVTCAGGRCKTTCQISPLTFLVGGGVSFFCSNIPKASFPLTDIRSVTKSIPIQTKGEYNIKKFVLSVAFGLLLALGPISLLANNPDDCAPMPGCTLAGSSCNEDHSVCVCAYICP